MGLWFQILHLILIVSALEIGFYDVVNYFADRLHQLPYLIAALLPALTFHEWGHAVMATKFGDDTPRRLGRLSLNPLAHLDPIGTLAIALIGFGWAKPVPINPTQFKNSWGEFWVASAGPLMNILLAIIFAMLINFKVAYLAPGIYPSILMDVFGFSLMLNLALAIFNLIPIGPLDGTHIVARLLPLRTSIAFTNWNAQYGAMALLIVIIIDMSTGIGILSRIVMLPASFAVQFLLKSQ